MLNSPLADLALPGGGLKIWKRGTPGAVGSGPPKTPVVTQLLPPPPPADPGSSSIVTLTVSPVAVYGTTTTVYFWVPSATGAIVATSGLLLLADWKSACCEPSVLVQSLGLQSGRGFL